jgi:hypothetical protein
MTGEDDMATRLENPEIEFLILADSVESPNGKLYMMGGCWSTIQLPQPDQPLRAGLAMGVLVPWTAGNEPLDFVLDVEHEDGAPVAPPLQGQLAVGRPADAIPGQSLRALITINLLWTFTREGTYRLRARLGEWSTKQTVFHVKMFLPAAPT